MFTAPDPVTAVCECFAGTLAVRMLLFHPKLALVAAALLSGWEAPVCNPTPAATYSATSFALVACAASTTSNVSIQIGNTIGALGF